MRMHETVVRDVEDETPPIVRWFPPAGPMRTAANELGSPLALGLGLVVLAAVGVGAAVLIRRSLSPQLRALKVDRLIVRKIDVLERAARYQ